MNNGRWSSYVRLFLSLGGEHRFATQCWHFHNDLVYHCASPTEHAQKYHKRTGAEVAGMTEEEQIALQQQMFAAAAAQAEMDTS